MEMTYHVSRVIPQGFRDIVDYVAAILGVDIFRLIRSHLDHGRADGHHSLTAQESALLGPG